MGEDKQQVQKMLDKLVEVLRMTSDLYDVVSLEYSAGRGMVYAMYASGVIRIVDVDGRTGSAMILEVVREIKR